MFIRESDIMKQFFREINNAREYIEMVYSFVFIGTFTASVPTGVPVSYTHLTLPTIYSV